MFGQRAGELLREVAYASADALPAYNVRTQCIKQPMSDADDQPTLNGVTSSYTLAGDTTDTNRASAPPQDESVRLILEELQQHNVAMLNLIRYLSNVTATVNAPAFCAMPGGCSLHGMMHAHAATCIVLLTSFRINHRSVEEQEEARREASGEEADTEPDWSRYTSQASAIIVHHDSILRNKRLLFTYM